MQVSFENQIPGAFQAVLMIWNYPSILNKSVSASTHRSIHLGLFSWFRISTFGGTPVTPTLSTSFSLWADRRQWTFFAMADMEYNPSCKACILGPGQKHPTLLALGTSTHPWLLRIGSGEMRKHSISICGADMLVVLHQESLIFIMRYSTHHCKSMCISFNPIILPICCDMHTFVTLFIFQYINICISLYIYIYIYKYVKTMSTWYLHDVYICISIWCLQNIYTVSTYMIYSVYTGHDKAYLLSWLVYIIQYNQ